MRNSILLLSLIFICSLTSVSAQNEVLRKEIIRLSYDAKGTVGVALLNIETRDMLSYNGTVWLGMQSVYKLPIAITILHLIDQGKYTLDQHIHISKADLPKNYSPLRDRYPEGNIDLPLGDLLSYMVSLSDNDVCDILLDKVTSKKEVESYMRQLGLSGIQVRATEGEIMASWKAQFTNRARAADLLRLMEITRTGKALSPVSSSFLWKIMHETTTTPGRLKGLLPTGTPVGHKSGTSATDDKGISPATNDVGMITLPNGQHLLLVVLVCNAAADKTMRDAVIARIAKAAYDFYQK